MSAPSDAAPLVVTDSYADEPPVLTLNGQEVERLSAFWKGSRGEVLADRPGSASDEESLASRLALAHPEESSISVALSSTELPSMAIVASFTELEDSGIPAGRRTEEELSALEIESLSTVDTQRRLMLPVDEMAAAVTVILYYPAAPTPADPNPIANNISWGFILSR